MLNRNHPQNLRIPPPLLLNFVLLTPPAIFLFLRLCFAKGDGDEFRDHLKKSNSAFLEQVFGRCELSKRQDWCLEAAAELFGVLKEVLTYTCKTRQLDANILRDSIFQRLELMHFEAYIHVCATMWVVAFGELRALTNSKAVELNPLQLNAIYDKLWDLGSLLQSDDSLGVFKDGYRPWEKVEELGPFYEKKEKTGGLGEERWKLLCAFEDRSDKDKYIPVLQKIFRLFGEGIHESLKRTMGDYLEATNGSRAESQLEPWVKARVVELIAHNNDAERPFAVIKLFDQLFPTMTLGNMSGLSQARVNHTFNLAAPTAKTKKKKAAAPANAGAAIAADPRLRAAVSAVCSVRRRKVGGEVVAAGAVTNKGQQIWTNRALQRRHLYSPSSIQGAVSLPD